MRLAFDKIDPRWQRRLKWSAAVLAGLALLVAILGYWVLPPWIKTRAETAATEALGRQVRIERLALDPFRLRLTVGGLRIAEADGSTDFLRVDEVMADAQLSSLFRRGAVLRELQVSKPQLHIERLDNAGRFNFSDILDRLAKRPPPASDEPARFALHNIRLSDGEVVFVDTPESARHTLSGLTVDLPFVSSIPSDIETFVEPRLAAQVNDAPFELRGKALPFGEAREAELEFNLEPTAVEPYLGYVPDGLPLRIQAGRLGAALKLRWSQPAGAAGTLQLSGRVEADDVALQDTAKAPLLGWKKLEVDIARLEPLAAPLVADITAVRLDGADLSAVRRADGSINLLDLAKRPAPAPVRPAPPGASAPASAPVAAPARASAPQFTLRELTLTRATVRLRDEAVPGGYNLTLTPLELRLQNFDLAGGEASLTLSADAADGEHIEHDGKLRLSPLAASGEVRTRGLLLERLRPYYLTLMPRAELAGKAQASARYEVAERDGSIAWKLSQSSLGLADLTFSRKGVRQPLLRLPLAEVEGVSVDGSTREVLAERVRASGMRARVTRDSNGVDLAAAFSGGQEEAREAAREVVEDVAASVGVQVKDAEGAPVPKVQKSELWQVDVKRTELSDWALRYEDRSLDDPIVMDLHQVALTADGASTRPQQTAKIALTGRVNRNGRMNISGGLAMAPARGDLKVVLDGVDILAAQPVLSEHYRVLLTQGALSANGQLRFNARTDSATAAPTLSYAGSLVLSDFNSLDQINDSDFVRWKTFGLSGIALQLSPLSFSAKEVLLQDFYSRLILSAQGRLNLRELTEDEEAAAAAPKPPATGSGSATVPPPPSQLPPIAIDRIVLQGGNVAYSDRLIRPNYDASLSSLQGSIVGLSSDPSSVASLNLTGSVDRTAPLVVEGKLNPLRQDRFLDIRAKVNGLDLTSASTYAGKYAGYGITRGRLSLDLAYRIDNRRLEASNRVVLNQLTFGEKVDSPDATKLPVQLAVSLLKDSNGDIDINLPVSGSLDDPEFSVGGIVVKVIVNLLTRAVTAPFALLGSALGGGGSDVDLSYVAFAPGRALLDDAAVTRLQGLVRALEQRPNLKLGIAGRAGNGELEGLRREQLNARLRTLKAQAMVKRGDAVGAVDALQITSDEYPRLLADLYRNEPIDNKPRNLVGMQRDLPVPEMEKLLLANTRVGEAELQALARSRAQEVRNWLTEKGKLSPERLFIINERNDPDTGNSSKPGPRVDFSLQ